jgi:hypothetical protein
MSETIIDSDDERPASFARASEGSSISKWVDQSRGKRKNDALPWIVIAIVSVVACSMSGVALGLSIGARDDAIEAKRVAERETRLQRLEVDELKIALKMQGIETHEGSKP